MNFFNIFKSKNKKLAEPSFSEAELNSWPSVPNENNNVPSLQELSEKSTYSKEAAKILEWAGEAEAEGAELEFQVVMKSQYGPLTLPVLVKRNDGGFLVYYSHCSEWNEAAVAKLLDWVIKLRSCDFIHTLKIEVCDSPEKLPLKVREIISKRTEHRMFLSMIPHLSQNDPDVRARVFAEGFGHFFNENKILNFDEESLALVEEWFKRTIISISKDSFYYQVCMNLLGSFYGRVLKEVCQAKWCEGNFPELEIGDKIKIRVHPFKIISDFIFKPRLENSPVKNLQLVIQEIQDNK
ncbi:MAG: hypothetical protein NE328_14070 [Lentisphaeraceae bacterium]|nr:hypothetical protein [Lentisphaeraceae bacterium]